jgi:ABC-type glycerol-3-phosphate transport system substrate-binding protein
MISIVPFAGCEGKKNIDTNDSADHSSNNGRKEIKWLAQWYGEGKKETLIREIARDFAFINQDYNVVIEFPHEMLKISSHAPSYLGTIDTIVKMVNSNTWPYDLMLCDSYIYQQISKRVNDSTWGNKYLVDFKDEKWFIDAHKQGLLNTSDINTLYHGFAPGAFIEGIWNLLYVSSEVEKKLGIKVKDYDMSIDDFIDYAKVVFNYNQSHHDKITFFSMQWGEGPMNLLNQLVMSEIENEKPGTVTDSYQILSKAYQKLENLAQYKPIEQYTTFNGERDLKQDKVLFEFSFTWIMLLWQANNPQGTKMMRPCELPSMTGKKASTYPGKYNAVFVVPKNAKNKDLAIKLMKFISTNDIAVKWEKYSKCPTGLKSGANFNEFGSDAFSSFSQHINKKYNNKLQAVNLAKKLFNTDKSIKFNISQLLKGEINAQDAVTEIKKQVAK